MKKSDLEKIVAKKTRYGQDYIHYVLNITIRTILEALANHEEVAIRGFATFTPTFVPRHKHRKPSKTTSYYDVPDKYIVKIQPSQTMNGIVNDPNWLGDEEE